LRRLTSSERTCQTIDHAADLLRISDQGMGCIVCHELQLARHLELRFQLPA